MLQAAAPFPLDLHTALRERQYRDSFAWPLPHAVARDFHQGINEQFLAVLADETDSFWRDTLVLAAPLLWMDALSRLEYALVAQSLVREGRRSAGGPPYIAALLGHEGESSGATTRARMKSEQAVGRSLSRRVVRTASWTPLHRLPKALLVPEAVAVSHNFFLRSEARRGGSIGFQHAPNLIAGLPSAELSVSDREKIRDLATKVSAPFARHPLLEASMKSRLAAVCAPTMEEHLAVAATLIRRLRLAPKVPKNVWAGTGGYRPVRAIRLEVRRRGGTARGFEHGGSTAMVDEPFGLALLELSVSDRFTLFTKDAAAAANPAARALARPFADADVDGGEGDPSFAVPLSTPHRHAGKKRVLYVSGPFLGPRQRMRPAINDVVKLDWQFRFAGQLASLPIDLLCQPHPEGAIAGEAHPLSEVAAVSGKNFEEVMDWADVIVTDLILSTTMWKAACSRKPIVLIDLDMCNLNPRFADLMADRFRIVRATYDERNLPQVDPGALMEAVMGAPAQADPGPFRALMAGRHG